MSEQLNDQQVPDTAATLRGLKRMFEACEAEQRFELYRRLNDYIGPLQTERSREERAWVTKPSVTHQGKFFQCTDITIEPKPVRQGKIPI